jgi:hypothetical protein
LTWSKVRSSGVELVVKRAVLRTRLGDFEAAVAGAAVQPASGRSCRPAVALAVDRYGGGPGSV